MGDQTFFFGKLQYRILTQIGPYMWQAEADTELTLSASPATAVGKLTLTLVNWRYNLVR